MSFKNLSEAITEMPTDWLAFFNQYGDYNEKLMAYYISAKKWPEELIYILAGFNGQPRPVITMPEPTAKKTKRATTSTKRTTTTCKFINETTGEIIECSPSALTKEDSPAGVVFSRGDKDAVRYYGKTKNGWKLYE